mmetsp:Transcript_5764/g.11432  ORF Transcript_5764/g.11432 Transcript_5764/m.11432 type:complete len:204 (-) Transcript_5764:1013-1624(-)
MQTTHPRKPNTRKKPFTDGRTRPRRGQPLPLPGPLSLMSSAKLKEKEETQSPQNSLLPANLLRSLPALWSGIQPEPTFPSAPSASASACAIDALRSSSRESCSVSTGSTFRPLRSLSSCVCGPFVHSPSFNASSASPLSPSGWGREDSPPGGGEEGDGWRRMSGTDRGILEGAAGVPNEEVEAEGTSQKAKLHSVRPEPPTRI